MKQKKRVKRKLHKTKVYPLAKIREGLKKRALDEVLAELKKAGLINRVISVSNLRLRRKPGFRVETTISARKDR